LILSQCDETKTTTTTTKKTTTVTTKKMEKNILYLKLLILKNNFTLLKTII
jgi:hypothetical protein